MSMDGVMVHCDLSTGTPRPLVAQSSQNFRLLSQHRSSGNSSHPPPHILSFCLARFVKRQNSMDQIMFGLPKREDKPSYQDTGTTNSCTCPSFQPHSCGSSGSFALFLRFHTPFHDNRQENTLARSSSSFYHFIIGLRPVPVFHLDQPVWCPVHDNIRQLTSIHLLPMEFHMHLTRYHVCTDYSLPPLSQWIGRAFSPSTKKLAPLPPCRPRLVSLPSLCTLGHPNRSQGSNHRLIS